MRSTPVPMHRVEQPALPHVPHFQGAIQSTRGENKVPIGVPRQGGHPTTTATAAATTTTTTASTTASAAAPTPTPTRTAAHTSTSNPTAAAHPTSTPTATTPQVAPWGVGGKVKEECLARGPGIPHLHSPIPPPRGKGAAIRGVGHGMHGVRKVVQGTRAHPHDGVPCPHRGIVTATDDGGAVRGPGCRPHPVGVPREGAPEFAPRGGAVTGKHLEGLVVAARQQGGTTGRKTHGAHSRPRVGLQAVVPPLAERAWERGGWGVEYMVCGFKGVSSMQQ